MMAEDIKKVAERLRVGLVYIRAAAIQISEKDAETRMGVLIKRPDGSGQLGASFEFDPFVDDVIALCDHIAPLGEDDAEEDGMP